MEDTYEELDAQPKAFDPSAVRKLNITLTEANYKSLQGKAGVPGYVNTNFYFASEEEAGALIPLYLNAAYPNFDNKDEITVTYNSLTKEFKGNTVTERETYTLTDEDYALGGTNFKNFDRWSQIETFLNARYTPLQGRLVNLTFNWFSNNQLPTTQVRTFSYFYTNGRWEEAYLVTEADYLKVDRNRNNAFATADEAMLPAYFDNFLKAKVFGAKAGDIKYVSYAVRYSATSTLQQAMAMIYDGSNWTRLTKTFFTEPKTLTFSFENGKWKPDLTVKYTLVSADYETIAGFTNVGTEANRANLKQFKNFYQAGNNPSDTRLWTDAQINAGLAELLKVKYPNAEVGQKFLVTYIAYRGTNVSVQTLFEKKANGTFEVVK
ncbi:hypothetical protein GCM10023183_33930 [Nibribacter koreensis]|uniref:Uncharacterized protein n=2 Tax=Nibribacter koreensis TaxID=1084519 RepID=A0ABP8FZ52_9BACT